MIKKIITPLLMALLLAAVLARGEAEVERMGDDARRLEGFVDELSSIRETVEASLNA